MSYLLDTNCFYRVSNNIERQNILRDIKPKVETSIIAPIEILNISPKDFNKRKSAANSFLSIQPKIIDENPDYIVSRAFGINRVNENIQVHFMLRALQLANSYNEAINGVNDFENRVVFKINPNEIRNWKKKFSDYFTQNVIEGNRQVKEHFRKTIRILHPNCNDNIVKKLSKQLLLMSMSREHSRKFAILGLSIRAGLFSENEFKDALNDNDDLNVLVDKSLASYNRLLDSYLQMYLGLHEKVSQGYIPEKNAIYDLEFFLHLDAHEVQYTFVTAEDFWINLSKEKLPERVIHLDDLFARYAG